MPPFRVEVLKCTVKYDIITTSLVLLPVQVKGLPTEEEIKNLSAREVHYIYHRSDTCY